jgi:hypothetical protein
MVVHISGGRHDGRPWPVLGPPDWGLIDVPDWEAEDLIRGGNAFAAEDPNPEPAPPAETWRPLVDVPEQPAAAVAPPQVSPLAEVYGAAEVGGTAPEPEQQGLPAPAETVAAEPAVAVAAVQASPAGPEPVTETVAQAPPPSAPKKAWIDYAVTQGADVHAASAMSKIDLMSRYGGRL